MGVTEQSLSNFLNGKRSYSYLAFVKLLRVLGLTLGKKDDNIGSEPVISIRLVIKDEIARKGRPIYEIAKCCNVNNSSLSSFLTGRRGINITALERIISELELTFVSYGEPTI